MTLTDVQELLAQEGLSYVKTSVSHGAQTWLALRIPNPHHGKHIHLLFEGDSPDPRFYDMEFGDYDYEFFDFKDVYLKESLLQAIREVLEEHTYIIIGKVQRKDVRFRWDGAYSDVPEEELNTMDEFHRAMERIRKPKSLWAKLTGKTNIYRIYTWKTYEEIRK